MEHPTKDDGYRIGHLMLITCPVDNFGTVVGANPTPYGILALWAVNCLLGGHSISNSPSGKLIYRGHHYHLRGILGTMLL